MNICGLYAYMCISAWPHTICNFFNSVSCGCAQNPQRIFAYEKNARPPPLGGWAPMYMWGDVLRSRFRSMLFSLFSLKTLSSLYCAFSLFGLFSNVCGLLFYLCPYQLPKLFQQGLTTCLSDIGFSLTNWHLTSTYRNSSHVPSSNNRCYKPCVSHLCLFSRLASDNLRLRISE